MVPATPSLTGFSGETTWPLGQLKLLVTIGDATHSTKAWMNFMIVKSLSPYNGIIGRSGLKAIQAVPSTVHGMLKFSTEEGIVTIRSSLLIPAECASVDTSSVTPGEKKAHPANLTVPLHPIFPDQEVVVGESLSDAGRTELCSLLKRNLDIFAWKPSDMTGVPCSIAEHRLNVRKGCPPIRQKKRGQAPERTKAIQTEVEKLVEAGIMREVYYHDWLSNPVMRLMDKAFKNQMGRNIEVYVDDLVIKSHTETEMVRDIAETFQTLRKINMKLNPKNCSFGLAKRVFLGATTKWSIMLGEHNITYRPRTSIKGKILADFLNEIPNNASQGASVTETQEEPWTLFTDGSSCVDGSGAGLILTNPDGVEFTYALRFQFAASNNEAEYEALIAGLRIATQMGVKNIQANVDSKLVANQVLGTYVAKEDNMIKYLEIAKGLVSGFKTFSIGQVPWSKNKKLDALSKIASTSFAHLSKQVLVEVLETKSIIGKEVTAVIEEEGPTWMTELVNYLKEGVLPEDEKEARKIRLKARQYELLARPWSVVAKAILLGYFWPTMHKDAQVMIRKPLSGRVGESQVPDRRNGLVHEVDRSKSGGNDYRRTNNGKQFADNPFKDWCDKLNITQHFASVKHPQSNGLVERANRSLGEGIKARLGEGNKNWVEELPHVLWAQRTMVKSSHGDTPFSLTYGTEAVIPAEIGMPTYHTTAVDVVNNDEELRLNLDLLEEHRELAAINEARSKSKMTKYYNSRVRGVAFQPGDFVYRSNDASHAAAGGKLGPKWEGPYEVTDTLGNGAYKLRSMDGTMLPRTWNVANLKRCYL
nr:hypothetical protein [Tanacetum cinerariifolium]